MNATQLDAELVAYLVEGFDSAGKLYAKIVHFTLDEARNSAAEFARHYATVTTTPLFRALAWGPSRVRPQANDEPK